MTLIRNSKDLEFTKDSVRILLQNYELLYNELKKGLYNKNFKLFKFLEDDISLKPLHSLLDNTLSLKRCSWGEQIIVDAYGDIYPCTYTCGNREFSQGNIKNQDYKSSLDKRLFVDYRKNCKKCWAGYLCGGTCYFTTYIKKNSVYDCNEIECIVNKYFCEQCIQLFLIIKHKKIDKEQLFK